MSEKIIPMEDRVMPARLTDNDTGITYELDFSRESIKFAESRGFKIDEIMVFPVTKLPEFFYYSFRKNHKKLTRSQTDAILDKLGGMSAALIERLSQLYAQAGYTHLIADEDDEKNPGMTLEL